MTQRTKRTKNSDAPLAGVLIIDTSRLLPGAVLARTLLDLGARLIKIEDPSMGDPMRVAPPHVDGASAGFTVFLRGAESVCLNLSKPAGAKSLRKLARHADVLIESFRSGTMEKWGLGPDRLRALNPGLTYCSLSGMGRTGEAAERIAHDLNITAASGLLSKLPDGRGIPQVQFADTTAAVLATSAILAALLRKAHTGVGTVIDQPLATGVLPALAWPVADAAAGGSGLTEQVLAGDVPCYRVYECRQGEKLAAGTLEAKFWVDFCNMLGLDHLAGLGLDCGEAGRKAAAEVTAKLGTMPREHWLKLALERKLPVSPVDDIDTARGPGGFFETTGLLEETPTDEGGLSTVGPFLPSVGRTPEHRAPKLGEHTEEVCAEFGLDGTS